MTKPKTQHTKERTPQLYRKAARVVKDINKGQSFKAALYNSKHSQNVRGLYGVVSHVLTYKKIILDALTLSKFFKNAPDFDPELAYIFTSELWRKGDKFTGDYKTIKVFLNSKESILKHLPDYSSTKKNEVIKPRYVRVNLLKRTVDEVIQEFISYDWNLVETPNTYDTFINLIREMKGYIFLKDFHLPDLLVFPSDFQPKNYSDMPCIQENAIVLQDKASLMDVHLLNPEPGSVVLDMCAAPGLKTTHIAALMKNKGTIYAVDMDEKRFEALTSNLTKYGVTCCKPLNMDALKLDKSIAPNVDYILLDPSCSGSGIFERYKANEPKNLERLKKLHNIQSKLLKHALNRFPQAKRIVYSTCSIYEEENSDVIDDIVQSNNLNDFYVTNCHKYLSNWPSSDDFSEKLKNYGILTPDEDFTNGFFIAMFEKEFIPGKIKRSVKEEDTDETISKRKKISKNRSNSFTSTTEKSVEANNDNKNIVNDDEIRPKKIKKKKNSVGAVFEVQSNVDDILSTTESFSADPNNDAENSLNTSKKKNKLMSKKSLLCTSVLEDEDLDECGIKVQSNDAENSLNTSKKKTKKNKLMSNKSLLCTSVLEDEDLDECGIKVQNNDAENSLNTSKKKTKKNKLMSNKSLLCTSVLEDEDLDECGIKVKSNDGGNSLNTSKKKTKKNKLMSKKSLLCTSVLEDEDLDECGIKDPNNDIESTNHALKNKVKKNKLVLEQKSESSSKKSKLSIDFNENTNMDEARDINVSSKKKRKKSQSEVDNTLNNSNDFETATDENIDNFHSKKKKKTRLNFENNLHDKKRKSNVNTEESFENSSSNKNNSFQGKFNEKESKIERQAVKKAFKKEAQNKLDSQGTCFSIKDK